MTKPEPLDPRFNAAVLTMAGKVCPLSFDIGDPAPASLTELRDHLAATGRIRVSGANSEQTIFACAETNAAFRAWHDWTHLQLAAEFTLDGELAVAHRQIEDLCRVFGHTSLTREWSALIMAEVYGQALYQAKRGKFPADQVRFDKDWVDDPGYAMHAARPDDAYDIGWREAFTVNAR